MYQLVFPASRCDAGTPTTPGKAHMGIGDTRGLCRMFPKNEYVIMSHDDSNLGISSDILMTHREYICTGRPLMKNGPKSGGRNFDQMGAVCKRQLRVLVWSHLSQWSAFDAYQVRVRTVVGYGTPTSNVISPTQSPVNCEARSVKEPKKRCVAPASFPPPKSAFRSGVCIESCMKLSDGFRIMILVCFIQHR